MDIIQIFSVPLGATQVEIKRNNRWCPGILVGRTREENPRLDVILADDERTIVCGVTPDRIRMAG